MFNVRIYAFATAQIVVFNDGFHNLAFEGTSLSVVSLFEKVFLESNALHPFLSGL